jgi:hypothetical protein
VALGPIYRPAEADAVRRRGWRLGEWKR